MRPLQTLSIVLYTVVFIIIGAALIAISLELITLDQIKAFYETYNLQTSIGLAGVVFILLGLLITHFTFGGIQRERTIAFNTPDGQVVISLSAIENFIKKLANQIPEIKDMRSNVIASKKGVNISARVSLWSDSNIPDVTEKIQGIIKNKVQDMLGIEEPITTKVHVAKIVHRESSKSKSPKEAAGVTPQPPYRNF
ncbi:MAG: alkaline shock response membrane anchor protein AmaP [Candidatus Omnitrophota bacterium]|nr:MAG: alkaline shock response membrane anchor protein AmaP [Candidatus Omnitrophota bacterium]